MTTKTKDTKKTATPKTAKYQVLDLVPMQTELQRLANIEVKS